jgi:ATP-dependent exoDNAse (exonuclease V) beta subunit
LRGRIEAIGGDAELLADFERSALEADIEGVGVPDWLAGLERELDKAPPSAAGGAGEIQLLRCHKSKGLQWPVVVTVGVGSGLPPPSAEYPLVERLDGRLAPHFTPLTRTEEGKKLREMSRQWETQRLLYVTLTRTQRLLVVSDSDGFYQRGKGSFADLCRWRELDWPTLAGGEIEAVGEVSADDEVGEGPVVGVDVLAALESAKNIWRRVLPHKLAKHTELEEEREFAAEFLTGGMEYGIWWHEVLRYFPWTSVSAAQEAYIAERLAVAPSACRGRGAKELALFMKSELREKLRAVGEYFLAETPFSALVGEKEALEGVIDLVITGRNGSCVVVDWKTNRPLAGETGDEFHRRLREIYERQLAAYRELLARKFGRIVSGCWLYATVSGALIEMG